MNTHSTTYISMNDDQRRFVKSAFDEGLLIGFFVAVALSVCGYLMFNTVSDGSEIVFILK